MKIEYRRAALEQIGDIQKTTEDLAKLPWLEEGVWLNEYFANEKIQRIREVLDSLESCVESISAV